MDKLIVCDIGGTNSRFAIASIHKGNIIEISNEICLKTNSFENFDSLLSNIKKINAKFDINLFEKIIIGIPGPITLDNIVNLTNAKWTINKLDIINKFPNTEIIFINDFIAQAYGCLTSAVSSRILIQKSSCLNIAKKDIAIVGSGTGLGHGTIKHIEGSQYIPIPSEAGHATFPFISEGENSFRQFIAQKTGDMYLSNNIVVSGEGLSLLHYFLTGKKLQPKEISKLINIESVTTKWFSKFFARCCMNYCLTTISSGGVLFISGGVAIKNHFLVNNDIFRSEFIKCPQKSALLKEIPIYLNTNEQIGLFGAAYYGFHR